MRVTSQEQRQGRILAEKDTSQEQRQGRILAEKTRDGKKQKESKKSGTRTISVKEWLRRGR